MKPGYSRRLRRLAAALMAASPFFIGTASAQKRDPVDVAVEFMLSNCYPAIDDVSRIQTVAKERNWRVPPQNGVLDVGKPNQRLPGQRSWLVEQEEQFFIIVVNRGDLKGRDAEICSVMVRLSPEILVPKLLSRLKASPTNTEKDEVQQKDFYEFKHPSQSDAILLIVKPSVASRLPLIVTFAGLR